uniref:Major facilitator superfamily (MFS) profile domain-containing protein n=1 Tax=Timema genevievae TaxID=629358 RepID=A0A7R9K0P8_TIMGE|nr:unnamed protein product [Timema genevievae]
MTATNTPKRLNALRRSQLTAPKAVGPLCRAHHVGALRIALYRKTLVFNPYYSSVQRIASNALRTAPRMYCVARKTYRSSILVLTFMAYTCYHLSRKSISVVKNVLNQNCSSFTMPAGLNSSDIHWCDWAPFNGNDSTTLLGAVDSSFLFAYAIAMYFSRLEGTGHITNYGNQSSRCLQMRVATREPYLMEASVSFVWILAGIVQTTGWPGVVSAVGKWFGKEKRGLIFGIWNSHTSIGNILGSVIAGEFVETNWGVSFIVPGAIIAFGGFIIFLFLVENPSNVHCDLPTSGEDKRERETSPLSWRETIQRTQVQEKAN